MSSNRTSTKGGKGAKTDKNHKTDKSDTGKGSGDKHTNKDNPKADDNIKQKVQKLIELTERSEEEVCLALHECNNDLELACELIFESTPTGEWSVKKKKTRQPSGSKQEKTDENSGADDWNDNGAPSAAGGDHEKFRGKGGRGGNRFSDRPGGWRGRERQENERNLEDGGGGGRSSDFPRDRRGRGSGGSRGGGGARGRGGGRAGGRYPPRGGPRTGGPGGGYNKQPIDTWDSSNNTWDNNTATTNNAASAINEETWDDFPGADEWTTEEYTGSLADTKVFTPSTQPVPDVTEPDLGGTLDVASQHLGQTLQINQVQAPSQSPIPSQQMSTTLNAAQTQYLTQLTQQNADTYAGQTYQSSAYDNSGTNSQVYGNSTAPVQYNSGQQYGSSPAQNSYSNNTYPTTYGEGPAQLQPARKTQRARVPPPSKIPASAVEMPGELNSSIGYLDVQFGAMDFMSDSSSFDGTTEVKYGSAGTGGSLDNSTASTGNAPAPTANLDLNSSNQNSNLDAYSPKTNTQSSISSALTQSLTSTDTIPQTSEHLTSAYNTSTRSSAGSATTQSVSQTALDIKQQSDTHTYNQSSNYNSYQAKNTYNSSTYSAPQATSTSSYQTNSYVNNQSGSYNTPNSFQNSYSSATAYQSNSNAAAFPTITQANSYSSANQSYAQNASQSVYGANTTGLNSASNYNSNASQYNTYNSSSNHKLVKDSSGYDNTNAVSTQSTTSNSAASSVTLSQTTVSASKTTTTLSAKNSSNVVSNVPPGVGPVMSTPYNVVQVPYFTPPVYSYEEMQLLQQRMPHMTTPYYDMSYQTPTTLAGVRDAAALAGNVGYSIGGDGRFARTDNNASPVPSTLSSQQTGTLTQGHQAQPLLAGTAGPPYFFAAPFNTLPNYPFYTQLPAATNAHGTNNSNQYPKPANYGSGYGSYDTLGQTQDYNKGAYVGNAQGQKGAGNASSAASAGNDLSAMYGKSHTALGKVNSYEKQGFHSGTPPPPFTGALHGSQNAGLAPSGTGYAAPVYIPTMAPHQQHHSTQMMHQPLHQDSGNSSGQRSQNSNQAKSGAKQYPGSYWNQA